MTGHHIIRGKFDDAVKPRTCANNASCNPDTPHCMWIAGSNEAEKNASLDAIGNVELNKCREGEVCVCKADVTKWPYWVEIR